MDIITVIDISAATFGLFSGLFFCVGVLHVKQATLETIATSFYGAGFTLARELVQQKSEFIFGASLLFLSFLVQVGGKFLSANVAHISATSSSLYGAALGLGVPTITLLLIYIPYRLHRKKALSVFMEAINDKI